MSDGTEATSPRRLAVCWSGGSGIAYGRRLVEVLLELGHEVHLAATGAALRVLEHEGGVRPPDDLATLFAGPLRARLRVHALDAVESTPASGSARLTATIVVPCSMGTLARIAHGWSSNLVERAADVALKEGRPLVVVPRETPLGVLHLENMLKLARLGAIVLPAMPGFYHRPRTVAELVDFVVGKILDRLAIDHDLVRRWQTPSQSPSAEAAGPFDEGER
ncbi:MAG: UbiX family flavin prenyltransferase [Planctomycetes bacterium]|nr:UbiX family flavin prenyltransferase [Planctomycetota bacterium]